MKLSIITVNLNNKIGLETTIKSVVKQRWQNFEYLVIDGGSSDGSLSVIKKNEEAISCWISESDNGIYNAMNKGIKIAKGDYVLFLNSGDYLNGETALQDFINHPNFKGDIIYGDYKFEKGEKIYPDILTPLFFIKSSLPHQSTFFKRTVFDEMGLYDEKYSFSSDRDFYIKCLLSSKFVFQHIKEFLTVFDLSGFSNNPKFIEIRKNEIKQIFETNYHVFYDDYKTILSLENEIRILKSNSLQGIFKRVKNKLLHIIYKK